jgi:hypothetical protein
MRVSQIWRPSSIFGGMILTFEALIQRSLDATLYGNDAREVTFHDLDIRECNHPDFYVLYRRKDSYAKYHLMIYTH